METNRLVKIEKETILSENEPKADLQNAGKSAGGHQRPKRHNRTKQTFAYLYRHPY